MSVDEPNRDNVKPMATGKPARDYSDSPLNTKEKITFTEDEQLEEELMDRILERTKKLEALEKAALAIDNSGTVLLTAAAYLPESADKDLAIQHIRTGLLWLEHICNELATIQVGK